VLQSADTVPVGVDGPPRSESIRFRHDPSLAFPSSDVSRVRKVVVPSESPSQPDREFVEITTTFLGLSGSVSPLPATMAEEVAQEDEDRRPRRDFLDVFHHRLLGLLYRGLARVSIHAEFNADGSDLHSKRLLALAGVDAFAEQRTDALSDTDMLRLVPIVVPRRGTRHAIEASIHTIFGSLLGDARVRVEPLQGAEIPFDDAQRVRLAQTNSRLGVDTIIGHRIYNAAGRILVVIGPVSIEAQTALAPGGELAAKLSNVLEFAVGGGVLVDVELVLADDARRSLRLDGTTRLGLDSFLAGEQGDSRVRAGDGRLAGAH
jgi:type VI secretion system protein ImpH